MAVCSNWADAALWGKTPKKDMEIAAINWTPPMPPKPIGKRVARAKIETVARIAWNGIKLPMDIAAA